MTNEEIILNHKNNKKGFTEVEILSMMELARKYANKDTRDEAIEILQKNMVNDGLPSKYLYAETCIKQIQNINV